MNLQFSFGLDDRDEIRMGLSTAILVIFSLLFVLSLYWVLRFEEVVLIHGPEDEALLTASPLFLIIVLILSFGGFYWLNQYILEWFSEKVEEKVQQSGDIDPDFPLTTASNLLANRSEEMVSNIKALHFLTILSLGWTIITLPFFVIGILFYILSQFISSIRVTGDIDPGIMILLTIIWFVGMLITVLILTIYKQSREVHYLASIISDINVNALHEENN